MSFRVYNRGERLRSHEQECLDQRAAQCVYLIREALEAGGIVVLREHHWAKCIAVGAGGLMQTRLTFDVAGLPAEAERITLLDTLSDDLPVGLLPLEFPRDRKGAVDYGQSGTLHFSVQICLGSHQPQKLFNGWVMDTQGVLARPAKTS